MGSLTGSLVYTADTQEILDLKIESIETIPGYINVAVDGLTVSFDIVQED